MKLLRTESQWVRGGGRWAIGAEGETALERAMRSAGLYIFHRGEWAGTDWDVLAGGKFESKCRPKLAEFIAAGKPLYMDTYKLIPPDVRAVLWNCLCADIVRWAPRAAVMRSPVLRRMKDPRRFDEVSDVYLVPLRDCSADPYEFVEFMSQ